MRDWCDALADLESYYPRCVGGTNTDEALRRRLVGWANNVFDEIERRQRWSLAYVAIPFVTTPSLATYATPAGITDIDYLYYLQPAGNPVRIERYDPMELRRGFGEGAASVVGKPLKYAQLGTNLQLFPVPDNTGPTAGNYTIIVEGHQVLVPIVETAGTTTAASVTLTVPSTPYLTARGVPAVGATGLSVRNAGYPQFTGVFDTHLTSWSAFPSGTTVTMGTASPTAVAALGAQVFFNSQNWLIQNFPYVVEFGVLCEIASYLKDDYRGWKARYEEEIERMAGFDLDRSTELETLATAELGQRMSQLRKLDVLLGVEVRGGVL
jgi:hypothetical protein